MKLPISLFRSTANITSRFSENADRNGLHFPKPIREVIFAPVLNKSIITSDFKRFWWVSALYAVILFFLLPFQHMLYDLPLKEEWQKEALLSSLKLLYGGASRDRSDLQAIFICTIPVFLAAMLFSYLHSGRAATMLHSLPIERKTLLGSHAASGTALIFIPVFITGVILSMLALFTGLGEYYTVVNVIEWTCLTMLYNILFFSIAVFVGMFTGNAIAHIVFTYIINVLPYGLYMLVGYGIETLLYGFSFKSMDTRWAQILPLLKVVGITFGDLTVIKGLLYLLTAFLFLGAAGFAYNRRKLEAAGSIVTFRTVQPVFKYGVTICLMLSAGLITGYLSHWKRTDVIVVYFIFAFIGYWISQMLLEKTVKVLHAYKGFLIFNAVFILLIAGASADVTGYVKRIPDVDEIESAYFGSSYNSWLSRKNKEPESEFFHTEGYFTEKANIKSVTDLHRILVENKHEEGDREEYIAYILKNGKSILRSYTFDENAVSAFLKPIYESMEYKEDRYPVLLQQASEIKYIEIGDRRASKKPLVLSDEKLVQSFTEVLKKELAEADYNEVNDPEGEYTYMRVTSGNDFGNEYNLRRSFEGIYKWLKDNGDYESVFLLPEEVDHVAIQTVEAVTDKYRGVSYTSAEKSGDLTDKAAIKELLDVCSYWLTADSGSGTYMHLEFYLQADIAEPGFNGYLSPSTPISDTLRQKLAELGMNWGN